MGMGGGGAVLFFADDGDGLAGEFDRGRFFDVFALGDGVFSAQLPPLPPSWMP